MQQQQQHVAVQNEVSDCNVLQRLVTKKIVGSKSLWRISVHPTEWCAHQPCPQQISQTQPENRKQSCTKPKCRCEVMVFSYVFVKVITFPPSFSESIAHSTALWASTKHFHETVFAPAEKTSIGSETATEWINKQDLDQNVLENVWAKCKFCLITGSLVWVDHWQLGLLLIVVGQLAGNTLPFGSAWNFFVTIFPVTVRPKRHYDSMSAKQRGMLAWEMLMNSDCVKQWLTNGVKQSLPTSTWCETTERESGSTFQTSWGAIFWFIHPSEQTEFNRTKKPKRPEAPNR